MSDLVRPMWVHILMGIFYCLLILAWPGFMVFFIWWYPVPYAAMFFGIGTVIYATRLIKKRRD